MSTDSEDTMKKKSTKAILTNEGERVTPITRRPAARPIEAPACPLCGVADTIIYATRHPTRWCKCRKCGHSYKFVVRTTGSSPIDDIQTR